MDTVTLSIKVSQAFLKKYRAFCEAHCLQVGKFTEQMLSEIIEDYHFGLKAQHVLGNMSGKQTDHQEYFQDPEIKK